MKSMPVFFYIAFYSPRFLNSYREEPMKCLEVSHALSSFVAGITNEVATLALLEKRAIVLKLSTLYTIMFRVNFSVTHYPYLRKHKPKQRHDSRTTYDPKDNCKKTTSAGTKVQRSSLLQPFIRFQTLQINGRRFYYPLRMSLTLMPRAPFQLLRSVFSINRASVAS
jgi:hypothetical protein